MPDSIAHSERGSDSEMTLLAGARSGDGDAFQRLSGSYRNELQLHCYRMLGSVHDAEDVVQETLLRAWRGVQRFEGRVAFRAWLYRIATNACLNAIASCASARRVLPEGHGPPSAEMPATAPNTEVAWLEPYPDAALDGIADTAPGPDARYEMREAVQLAFIAAIQYLPPRQRAALLLRDVLGWSAVESAGLLDASVASVTSALQRARATLAKRLPGAAAAQPASDEQRTLLDRYVRTWESADVERFVALLREDSVFSMPPWPQWYRGREAIRTFFAWTFRPGGHGPFRVVATCANCQPAFAFYSRFGGGEWQPHSIHVVTVRENAIADMTSFVTPAIFPAFGLPDLRLAHPRRRLAPDEPGAQ